MIAPLDWGLGHATRCIPLIKMLQKNGFEVILATEEKQKILLQSEFTTISIIKLKGYHISYAKQKRWLPFKIIRQLPKIMFSIYKEHHWLDKTISELNIDLVISDNRFGLWTKKVPCIFLTHQLQIEVPYKWIKNIIQKINYYFINKYTQCWIPDFEGENNIAGNLSHPSIFPSISLKYIGPLSRLEKVNDCDKKYNWLVILSGPEPQRSLLENKILSVASQLQGKVLIVRGKPGSKEKITLPQNCSMSNHLTTKEMQQAFCESEYIISRSGYTTVMEVLCLQKKAILIPTPGQTEQEYLAKHLMNQNWCYCFNQEDDFLHNISKIPAYIFKFPNLQKSFLKETLDDLFKEYPIDFKSTKKS